LCTLFDGGCFPGGRLGDFGDLVTWRLGDRENTESEVGL